MDTIVLHYNNGSHENPCRKPGARDTSKVTNHLIKKNQHNEKYVDENPIDEDGELKDQDDNHDDKDPEGNGDNKEDEGRNSRQTQETSDKLAAKIESGNVAPDENILDEPTPRENNTMKKENAKDPRTSDPTRDKGKGVIREPRKKTAPTAPWNNMNLVNQPLQKRRQLMLQRKVSQLIHEAELRGAIGLVLRYKGLLYEDRKIAL
uniref:Uncharacterized protein n=1 Tax=Cannabis sativa TaxID=3483 RepID=A0A803PBP1_CANSA